MAHPANCKFSDPTLGAGGPSPWSARIRGLRALGARERQQNRPAKARLRPAGFQRGDRAAHRARPELERVIVALEDARHSPSSKSAAGAANPRGLPAPAEPCHAAPSGFLMHP